MARAGVWGFWRQMGRLAVPGLTRASGAKSFEFRISNFEFSFRLTGPMYRLLPRLGLALVALLVILLAGVIVARVLFTRYLHSEAFRQALGQGAANALNANHAEFAPLEFDGSMVYGEKFRATRDDGGGFSSIDADQLRATLDWHGMLHHTVQVDEMAIQRVNIEPPATGPAVAESAPGVSATPAPIGFEPKGWTVDLRKTVINEANWHWSDDPPGGITGTALTLTPDGQNAWVIAAQGGTLQAAGWPALDLDTASMRWQSPTLYINSASLHNGSSRFTVTGSVEERQSVNLRVQLDGVDVQPLEARDWRERLTGRLTGEATVQAPLGTPDAAREVTVSGSLAMVEGQLTALPILDEIGTFTHTERFRQLELTRASADFTRTPDRLEVRNMVVESEGLIRVEGSYTIVNGQIDGTFQVGLTPATLQWIPGSQDEIFVDSRGGYRWTPMRLTGPVDHPVDDLTPRLVAAAGNSLIQGAQGLEGTVKKAGEGVLDLLLH